MRTATIIHYSVNLIEYQRSHGAQHPPTRFGSKQEIQGFRCGDQNVRRLFNKGLALRRSGVAGADFSAHINVAPFRFVQ